MLNNLVMLRLCFGNASVIVQDEYDEDSTFSMFKQMDGGEKYGI